MKTPRAQMAHIHNAAALAASQGEAMDAEAPWIPPATFELTSGDGRTIRYCAYGLPDGLPVIFHSGSPSTRWKRPAVIEAIEQSGLRMLMPDRPGYGGSTRQRG